MPKPSPADFLALHDDRRSAVEPPIFPGGTHDEGACETGSRLQFGSDGSLAKAG
jgi:hypothetical protein